MPDRGRWVTPNDTGFGRAAFGWPEIYRNVPDRRPQIVWMIRVTRMATVYANTKAHECLTPANSMSAQCPPTAIT